MLLKIQLIVPMLIQFAALSAPLLGFLFLAGATVTSVLSPVWWMLKRSNAQSPDTAAQQTVTTG
jgi:hypothetical protein